MPTAGCSSARSPSGSARLRWLSPSRPCCASNFPHDELVRKHHLAAGSEQGSTEFYEHSVHVFDTRDAKAALKAAVEAVDTGRPFPKSNFEEQ